MAAAVPAVVINFSQGASSVDNKAVIMKKHKIYVMITISSHLLLFSSCIQVFILNAHPLDINSHIETHYKDAYKCSKVARCLQTKRCCASPFHRFEASHLGHSDLVVFHHSSEPPQRGCSSSAARDIMETPKIPSKCCWKRPISYPGITKLAHLNKQRLLNIFSYYHIKLFKQIHLFFIIKWKTGLH